MHYFLEATFLSSLQLRLLVIFDLGLSERARKLLLLFSSMGRIVCSKRRLSRREHRLRPTVYVRRVLEEALRASAAAIVLAHNHPSGNPEPSLGDDETTQDIDTGARLVGLVLIDHVVIGETEHYSYADSGRLQEFRES